MRVFFFHKVIPQHLLSTETPSKTVITKISMSDFEHIGTSRIVLTMLRKQRHRKYPHFRCVVCFKFKGSSASSMCAHWLFSSPTFLIAEHFSTCFFSLTFLRLYCQVKQAIQQVECSNLRLVGQAETIRSSCAANGVLLPVEFGFSHSFHCYYKPFSTSSSSSFMTWDRSRTN